MGFSIQSGVDAPFGHSATALQSAGMARKESLADCIGAATLGAVAKQACIPMLKALADDTRWRIVRELLCQPLTVGELVGRLDVSQYNVSKHVRILREAGIVETERDGKHVQCSVAADFRKRLTRNETVLDLGCCTFRFDEPRSR